LNPKSGVTGWHQSALPDHNRALKGWVVVTFHRFFIPAHLPLLTNGKINPDQCELTSMVFEMVRQSHRAEIVEIETSFTSVYDLHESG
jgi:hypothetical protein